MQLRASAFSAPASFLLELRLLHAAIKLVRVGLGPRCRQMALLTACAVVPLLVWRAARIDESRFKPSQRRLLNAALAISLYASRYHRDGLELLSFFFLLPFFFQLAMLPINDMLLINCSASTVFFGLSSWVLGKPESPHLIFSVRLQ